MQDTLKSKAGQMLLVGRKTSTPSFKATKITFLSFEGFDFNKVKFLIIILLDFFFEDFISANLNNSVNANSNIFNAKIK